MEFIDLKAQYKSIKEQVHSAVFDVFETGEYINGKPVGEIEKNLAEYIGAKHCISCSNGTDALTLSLIVEKIGAGDAVFVPDFTFFATGETVAFRDAVPVMVDIDEKTYNISPQCLEKEIERVIKEDKLTPKAIIAVDLFGLAADYKALRKIADKYNLLLIGDSAQGFGCKYHDKYTIRYCDIVTTSFFPAKPLGCYGDGGAVFTNDDTIAALINSFKVHGRGIDKYDNVRIGLNARLDTIQAAILLEKFKVFPAEVERRNEIAALYTSLLKDYVVTPYIPEGSLSVWAQYTVLLPENLDRTELMEKMKQSGIPTMIYYKKPLHKQSAFAYLHYKADEFPVSNKASRRVLSLPMHPYLTDEQVKSIAAELIKNLK